MRKTTFFRNVLALAVAATMSVGFTSCGEDDEVVANPTSVSIDAAGGTQTIQVTSNTNWTVSGNPGWLTVAPTQGSQNGTITVTANSTSESRSCVLYIQAGDAQATVSVNQSNPNSNPNPNPNPNPLVGTWKHTFEDGYDLITFYDNNRGTYSQYENGRWDAYNESFTYSYANNMLTLDFDNDDDHTAKVISLTSTTLELLGWDHANEVTIFIKQGAPNPLVGTWKANFGSDSWMSFTFNDNGTGAYTEYDNGHWDSYNETFTYTYVNNIITIHWDEDYDYEEVETIPVRSLTSTELVMNFDEEGYRTFYKQ